ncbi:hypothetical protein AAG906_011268 [Vitis piasezkii]
MCGGDDHLAWKRPVSLEACRGLRTIRGLRSFDQDFLSYTWVHLRAFRASLVTVRIQYFLIWSPDWFFILSVDLPSWVKVERKLTVIVDQFMAAMASIQEALASLK